jgi:hypothetical protein
MGEASTPSAVAAFFARHGIKACTTELSEELRNAAHATCSKLTKYFERADLMDFMYLADLMDPSFKDNVILKNLGLHSTGIINLCQEKVVQIDGLLSRGQGEAEMEVDPIIRKDQSKFDRIVMKCITGENETERAHSISFDSIETEWDAHMRSPRSPNAPGFETLSFWKMESDRYPKLSKVARVLFAFSAISTSCERSFSLARNKIGFRRHRLSPLTLQRLMCSSYNRMALEKEDINEVLSMDASGSDDNWDDDKNLSSVFSRALES